MPKAERAGAVEGVGGGINPSPLRLRGALVDLISGLAHGLHALRPKASADFSRNAGRLSDVRDTDSRSDGAGRSYKHHAADRSGSSRQQNLMLQVE